MVRIRQSLLNNPEDGDFYVPRKPSQTLRYFESDSRAAVFRELSNILLESGTHAHVVERRRMKEVRQLPNLLQQTLSHVTTVVHNRRCPRTERLFFFMQKTEAHR